MNLAFFIPTATTELGEQLGIAYETKAEKALKAQLQEKEEHIKELESQLRVYKQIHKVTE